jgi:hypothetical protein
MPETNDDGWIALKRFQTINKIVTVGDEQYAFQCRFNIDEQYAFQCRFNICMAWVRPEHVDQVLSITKMCCGGNRKPMFRYAQALDVHRWTNGGR